MPEIIIVARLQAKPGRGADLLSLFSELVPRVLRDEPGVLRYALYVEPDRDPLRLTVIEKYASRAAADTHLGGAFAEYLPRLLEMLDGPLDAVELSPANLAISVDEADAARLSI